MNEQQQTTLQALHNAKRDVELAELKLFEAKQTLSAARKNHTKAVNRDRTNWEGGK